MASTGYPCRFPGCNARYQRKGHLHRHETQHTGRQALQCLNIDTLRRHIQTVHGIAEPAPQIKHACTHCRNQKTRCHDGPPCTNYTRLTMPRSIPLPPRIRRSETEDRFVGRYFDLFHPHWPFIHRGTFIEYETPLLVQSMVVIGLWMTEEENTQCMAVDLHNVLDAAIRQQTEQWDGSLSEEACASCSWPIPTYQAILLHIISAGMIRGSRTLLPDLKPSLTSADANLLRRFVASCKKLGMFYYPNILARFSQNEPAAYFNLALFKVCKSFSGSGRQGNGADGLSDDREETVNWGMSARDLQFPLPRNTPLWNALNAEEWFAADTEDVFRHSLYDTLEQD
ncbi:hypothetical protein BDV10DRAFT_198522 [Aspergillus recurvatus]